MESRAFEGTITQVIKMPGLADLVGRMRDSAGRSGIDAGNNQAGAMLGMLANLSLKAYIREDKVAYEMSMMGGLMHARAIIDRNNRTITILSPDRRAIVTDFRALDTMRKKIDDSIRAHPEKLDSLADATPKATGKKSVIDGFEVEEYAGKMKGMDLHIWATEDPRMKYFEVIRDAVLGRMHTGAGGLEEVFSILGATSSGKVPVKAEALMEGKTIMTSELTEIKEGKVDDAMFQIPKDYEIVHHDTAPHDTVKKSRGVTAP